MPLAFNSVPHTTVFTKNPIVFTYDASANYAEDNHRLISELQVNFGSGFITVAEQEWRAHPASHIVTMRIDTVLNAVFSEFDFDNQPLNPFNEKIPCTKNILPFRFSFSEKYNDVSEPSVEFNGSAIIGGLNFQSFPNISFFEVFLPAEKKFMTWLPQKINLLHHQPFTLFFFNYSSNLWDNLAVSITAFYLDASGVTSHPLELNIASSVKPGELFFFKSGPYQLRLYDIYTDKKLIKYNLTLINKETQVSETKTFVLDQDNRKRSRIFAYLNSLGGIDHFFTSGKTEAKPEYASGLAVFDPVPDASGEYNEVYGQKYQFNQTESLPVKVRTGFKTLEEINCLRDFLLSPFKLEFNRKSNKYLPIILDSKSVNFPKDNDGTPSVEFTFRYAFDNKTFTPDGLPES